MTPTMTQHKAYQADVLSAIDGEIATAEADYKAALAAAGERLQAARLGARAARDMAAVAEAPLELEPELAVTLHKLETRLDQLKELRDWIKIDPELAHFVIAVAEARAQPTHVAQSATSAPTLRAPQDHAGSRARSHGAPLALMVVVAVLALVAGWLLSLLVPAAVLLAR